MAELPKQAIPDMTAERIRIGCMGDVSLATFSKSFTSRCAIAAGSGITSAARIGVLMKSADALGFKGVFNLQPGD